MIKSQGIVSSENNDRSIPKKVGVEVELMAPLGSSRKQLAEKIAHKFGGQAKAFFHLDSEPSKVKGKPIFYHLTQAFDITDVDGKSVAHCVDDITLQDSLDKTKQPSEAWYRIVSDDARLLRLIANNSDASDSIEKSLQQVGKLFGTKAIASKGGVYKLCDDSGASIALAAPLPGERERACELVTAPLLTNDTDTLFSFLETANELHYQLPKEGATHLHFDGSFFTSSIIFLNTLRFLHKYRLVLRRLLGTNLNCKRLGDWPRELLTLIESDELTSLSWEQCRLRIAQTNVTKYCDFNIRNLIYDTKNKHTLEVRILPSSLDASYIYQSIHLFQAIFFQLPKTEIIPYQPMLEPIPKHASSLLSPLTLEQKEKCHWMKGFRKRYDEIPAKYQISR